MSDSRVSVGWSLRGRLLLLWGVVLAMMLPFATASSAQAAGVTADTNVASVRAPDLMLTESTAIAGETVKAAGTLPGEFSRPIVVQGKVGRDWMTLAKATTSSAGAYATSFSAPRVGSYSVRVVAPKVKVARKTHDRYASAARTLTVVAQSASLSMPATLAQSQTGTATMSFGPVRVGRVVGLQVMKAGVWTSIATGQQSSTGGATLTFMNLTAGSYSYRAWTAAANGAPGFASSAAALEVTAAEVPSITGTVTDAGPIRQGLANVRVSVYSPSTGTDKSATTATDGTYSVSGLAAGTDYQVWFYPTGATGGSFDALGYLDQAYDNQQPMFGGTPTPVTVTEGATTTAIDAALAVGGAITGTVSDAAGTQQGLAGVSVRVEIPSNGNYYGFAVTAADGSYTVQGMPAGTDYKVCFFAEEAKGGSTDTLGYLNQCFDNQPASGTPTPVAVTLGAARAGVDAALAVGGAVSGTVVDAGGTHQGLANVTVGVYSPSGGGTNATTGADGTYTARGLPAGADYQVCFYASGATGGSTDATGYLDQCFDNQPMSGTPTPVTVSVGATSVGTNAALVGGGAISGTVSDAGGTGHGLANAWLDVSSPSTGTFLFGTTAADGSYTVSGLPAATDYTVCFHGSGATGGSSDALGYVDQCYDNQPTSATAIPVTVTSGASQGGVNAALAASLG